jgi:hypothetical protein
MSGRRRSRPGSEAATRTTKCTGTSRAAWPGGRWAGARTIRAARAIPTTSPAPRSSRMESASDQYPRRILGNCDRHMWGGRSSPNPNTPPVAWRHSGSRLNDTMTPIPPMSFERHVGGTCGCASNGTGPELHPTATVAARRAEVSGMSREAARRDPPWQLLAIIAVDKTDRGPQHRRRGVADVEAWRGVRPSARGSAGRAGGTWRASAVVHAHTCRPNPPLTYPLSVTPPRRRRGGVPHGGLHPRRTCAGHGVSGVQ